MTPTWLLLVQWAAICVNLYCGWEMWREAARYRRMLADVTRLQAAVQENLDATSALLAETMPDPPDVRTWH